MGWLNILGMGLLLAIAVGLIATEIDYIKENYTPNLQGLKTNDYNPFANKPVEIPASGEVIQFYPNFRFASPRISYYFNPNCNEKKISRILEALNLLSEETKLLQFYETNEASAEILFGCSRNSYETEKNVFVAGEGGPTNFFNSTLYPIIIKGKVVLYEESKCDYPITELHEILHVFAFDHINDSKMILYPYIDCTQVLNPKIVSELIRIYSIESLPELYFANYSASKDRKYLNIAIQVNNGGLANAEKVNFEVYADGQLLKSYDFGKIEYGSGATLEIENIQMQSSTVKNIKLIIVSAERELDETNNVLEINI